MSELDKALADIVAIRTQMARGTAFRGYGPAALVTTGGLALATATAQTLWLDDPTAQPLAFLAGWVATAICAVGLIGAEMLARARRHHSGLADAMIHNAVEQFLPAAAAGGLLALVLLRVAPESLWLLPGLWQILVSLGLFASARSLPRGVALVGAWYLVAALGALTHASADHALSPWAMGVPFAIGQTVMAIVLHRASGDRDDA